MEELQDLWRKASVKETESVSQSELEAAISRRSSDELAKFRQVIKWEYFTTWPIVLWLIYETFRQPGYWMATVPLLAFCAYMIYFYRKALTQSTYVHYDDSIQVYLQQTLTFLKSYVRHFKIICWASVGIGFLYGFMLDEYQEGKERLVIFELSTFFMVAFVLLVVFGMHFYIKYLYQARIDAIENLLKEFREN
ncbi:MAG: hypothetical protein AAF944_17330 [Bacteroidota bacterium]